MSPQEIFDTVLIHLRKQGEASYDPQIGCMYRNPEGLKCAAGVFIPDEDYEPRFECTQIDVVIARAERNDNLREWMIPLVPHSFLLRELQRVHDNFMPRRGASLTMEDFETRMKEAATIHRLSYKEPSEA